MNRIATRTRTALILALVLLVGLFLFLADYTVNAPKWIVFPGSPHVYKGGNLVESIRAASGQNYYVWQQDYYTGPYDSYEVENVEFYYPLEAGQIGYSVFPGAPYERYDFEFRGEAMENGFRRVSN